MPTKPSPAKSIARTNVMTAALRESQFSGTVPIRSADRGVSLCFAKWPPAA
ncbi:MAG TPA: hypothetical protein VGL61_36375 [Kofleriaceae bacterium]